MSYQGEKKTQANTDDLKLSQRDNFYSWKSSESSGNADNHLHKWGIHIPKVTHKEYMRKRFQNKHICKRDSCCSLDSFAKWMKYSSSH